MISGLALPGTPQDAWDIQTPDQTWNIVGVGEQCDGTCILGVPTCSS